MSKTIKCPTCDYTEHHLVEVYKDYEILTCLRCKLCFSHPMLSGDSEFYRSHFVYKKIDKATVIQHYYSAANRLNQYLLRLIPKGSRILDIGCGLGGFVKYALEQGDDAYGIDFNDDYIHVGQKVLGLGERLILCGAADLHKISHFYGSFDLVTLFEVIEHVENPQQLIQNARKMLVRGGLLATSCPNEARWQPTGRIFADYPPHHLTRWRPDTLRRFLEKQGLEHVRTEIESSFSDLLWVAYVNYSAKRRLANVTTNYEYRETTSSKIRSLKMTVFSLVKMLCIPLDLGLKAAGIGTKGMRMIVKKV